MKPHPLLYTTKQEIIDLLALQGHWITTQPDLQVNMFVICSISLSLSLEPPETKLLLLKGNTLHFLFDPIWTVSVS